MKTNTYSVPNMSCGSCKAKIEGKLNTLSGIDSANVEVANKQLTVTFDDTIIKNEDIIEAVDEVGYIAEKE